MFGAIQKLDSLLINPEDHGATINECLVVLRPIGKAIDFLFRFPTGRLILAAIIFVSTGMAGMRLFTSLTFGVIIGIVGAYLLLWEKDY